jgi:drug/metabolite transporter (DMT)-like permease
MASASTTSPVSVARNVAASARRRLDRRGLVLAALYLLICVIWGTTWIAIKVGVRTVPPLTAAGLRFALAFPLLVVVVRRWPGATLRYPARHRALFAFVSVAYLIVPYALLNASERSISSGLTAILFSTVSVFMVVFARLLLRTKVRPRQWIGVGFGVALLAVLVTHGRGGLAASSLLAPLSVLLAAVLHALSYVVIRKHGNALHALTVEALPIGIAGLVLTGVGVVVEHPHVGGISLQSAIAIGYLAAIPSVAGFAVYFYLLQRIEPVLLSFVFIFFPVIAVAVSSVVEHAAFPLPSVALVIGIVAAFALTKGREEQEAAAEAHAAPGTEPRASEGWLSSAPGPRVLTPTPADERVAK